jgi:hypothetical protein
MKSADDLLPDAIRLHDRLEAEGHGHDEIAMMLGAGFAYSLLQMPREARALHIHAHLDALSGILTETARRGRDRERR